MKITADVISMFRNGKEQIVYAKAGDDVTMISISGDVLIAEDKKGKRFPVRIEQTDHDKTVESDFMNVTREFKTQAKATSFVKSVRKIAVQQAETEALKDFKKNDDKGVYYNVSQRKYSYPAERAKNYVRANAPCHSVPLKISIVHE